MLLVLLMRYDTFSFVDIVDCDMRFYIRDIACLYCELYELNVICCITSSDRSQPFVTGFYYSVFGLEAFFHLEFIILL